MKGRTATALAFGAALALAGPALADNGCEGVKAEGSAKLVVDVQNVRSAQGEMAITVYADDKRRFLARGQKLARVRIKATAPSTTACFWLPPAYYAVAVYHDANGDRDFNRNAIGLPTEGFGFSNNPDTKIGLPPFGQVRFRLPPGEATATITLKYLR
jgi:uncharacterized protein (DUF2141 family)